MPSSVYKSFGTNNMRKQNFLVFTIFFTALNVGCRDWDNCESNISDGFIWKRCVFQKQVVIFMNNHNVF